MELAGEFEALFVLLIVIAGVGVNGWTSFDSSLYEMVGLKCVVSLLVIFKRIERKEREREREWLKYVEFIYEM